MSRWPSLRLRGLLTADARPSICLAAGLTCVGRGGLIAPPHASASVAGKGKRDSDLPTDTLWRASADRAPSALNAADGEGGMLLLLRS